MEARSGHTSPLGDDDDIGLSLSVSLRRTLLMNARCERKKTRSISYLAS